jgi:hypothetical protein
MLGVAVSLLAWMVACTTARTAVRETATASGEETQVRQIVEGFGHRLQAVSLQSPDAPEDMSEEYSPYVSPILLDSWLSDPSDAPGRFVSSPWPDRIEITALTREDPERYAVEGIIVEVTSSEVMAGDAANEVPVRLVVQKIDGRWLIVEYGEER